MSQPARSWKRINLWRVRRALSRPLVYVIIAALLLAGTSSFYYFYVKAWMFGTEDVLLVGLSGRSVCVQRVDYNDAVRRIVMHNAYYRITAPPPTYWPRSRWIDAGWLQDVRWDSKWLPEFSRRSNGWMLLIPWWTLVAVSLVLLMLLHFLHNRAFCRGCGYDLKGMAGDLCPECGRGFRKGRSAALPTPTDDANNPG